MNSLLFAFVSSFVFVVVVDAQGSPSLKHEEFISAKADCVNKLSPSPEDLKMFTSGGKLITRGSQCFAACVEKTLGIMGSDNKMSVEKTAQMLTPLKSANPDVYDKLMSITKDCKAKETTETDECIAAKKFYDCFVDKKEAAGISKW